MIKVLQVLAGLGRGGMETFIMNVYRSIDRESVQFDFLLRSKGGAYIPEAESLGANIFYIGKRHEGFIQFWNNLDLFFREHAKDYAAVHVHTSTLSSVEPLYYAKKYGVPVRIVHSHSSSVSGNKLHYISHYLCKLFIKSWATDYLGCSKEANEWLFKYTGIYSRAIMVPNGVLSDDYKYSAEIRKQLRDELNLKVDDLVVGHVGRFAWMKNHKFLLDVFKKILESNPHSKLMLVGKGPLMEVTKCYAKSIGVDNNVLFMGLRNDVSRLLQTMDVFIFPSIYEGLPVCLVESQASGLLTICSDTVSHDSSITNCIYYLRLEDGADRWCSFVMEKMKNFKRIDQTPTIKSHGYDIKETATLLKSIYKRS